MTTLTFDLRKETKGARVFDENDDQDAIGSLYVRKAFMAREGHADAKSAIVTIEFV